MYERNRGRQSGGLSFWAEAPPITAFVPADPIRHTVTSAFGELHEDDSPPENTTTADPKNVSFNARPASESPQPKPRHERRGWGSTNGPTEVTVVSASHLPGGERPSALGKRVSPGRR